MATISEHGDSPHPRVGQPLLGRAGDWAVEVHGLTKRFGPQVAVDTVDLLVPRGSAFGYLGPNGAGKTTLIRTLLGLTRADSGTMWLLGIPVPAQRRRALARVGAIVDEPRFHGHLTGRENLQILAAARGGDAGQQIGPALDRTRLTGRVGDKVSAYSMGMRQRLGVAACLLADPQLLILDEPMNGLDPAGMHEMRDMIRGLADEGRTVMLSSHLLSEVQRTCDQVAIVDHGKVIRQGPIGELTADTGAAVEVRCPDPPAAARALGQPAIASRVTVTEDGLTVTLTAGPAREQAAGINRRLVGAGISVYGLRQTHASLEDWFLSEPLRRRTVTARSLAADGHTSWVPPLPLIGVKLLELRKRRTLMIVTTLFTVALPVIFYAIRLILHASSPAHYAPAGEPDAFATIGTLIDEFGFIIAVALGATAGTADLTDGMFRHLAITGRSRLALYLARIPAGLAILLSLAAAGITVACLVTAFAHTPLTAGGVTPSAGALAGGTVITPQGAVTAPGLPPMPTWAVITVIAGWILGWSAIGAWKMATRDA